MARLGVARIFLANIPGLTPDAAVDTATKFIRALHDLNLEVGPIAAFGPQDGQPRGGLDALDLAADMIEQEWGRKPWLP